MANYLYNGVELPDINEVWTDKDVFPYAFIVLDGAYSIRLYLTKEPVYFYKGSTSTVKYYISLPNPHVLCNYSDNSWVRNATSSFKTNISYYTEGYPPPRLWASSDLVWEGTDDVVVYASDPKPLPIGGVWKFNETVKYINNLGNMFVGTTFTSNGGEFNSIRTYRDILTTKYQKLQYGFADGSGKMVDACIMDVGTSTTLTLGWTDEGYRYIDFGETAFEPNVTFYEFLTANATYQEPEQPERTDLTANDLYCKVNGQLVKLKLFKKIKGELVAVDEFIKEGTNE